MTLEEEVRELAKFAKAASAKLAQATTEERNGALYAMAAALRAQAPAIVEANGEDMEAARAAGTTEALLDRLMLDESRVFAMADALEEVAALPDPLGVVSLESTLYNGIELRRVSVPLGVVAMVYEARPNVTADAAGVCVKSGNACILRGGSLAARSNEVIADVLAAAAVEAGLPEGSICAVTTTDRAATDVLMGLHGLVDVLIPRGGAGLIRHCVEHAKVPVIETGTGNCHVYVHASADPEMARAIIRNAKCRRFGVCNAAETLLVDAAVADAVLPSILADMKEAGVLVHGDARVLAIAEAAGLSVAGDVPDVVLAGEADWETEYLGPELAVKCVEGLQEAIDHVNRYGTKHSEAIVASDEAAQDAFLAQVDAAAVYANASTAFTDGGQFGLGAEIGISTQKIHARGPFAADALTTLIHELLLPLVYCHIALASAGAALPESGLDKLADGLKKLISWLLCGAVTAFTLYLSVSGVLTGSADRAAVKAAQTAVSGAVPVVGSILAESAEMVLSAAHSLRAAIGAAGVLGVLLACLAPLVRLSVQFLLYRAAAFVSAVSGVKPLERLLEQLGDAFTLVLGMTAACAALLLAALLVSISMVVM